MTTDDRKNFMLKIWSPEAGAMTQAQQGALQKQIAQKEAQALVPLLHLSK